MAKTFGIDLSGDRLIAIAEEMVDSHNYIGALKMLNKNAEIRFNDEDSYMLYAEIFDDLGLYEKCVNGWFRYMDVASPLDMSDCYEGLAVSFMNLGNEHFSAFYYNKLLFESDELDPDMREDILNDFLATDENPLKFAYPPALADCSDIINTGVKHMKAGEFDLAAEKFGEVDEGNRGYISARNYIAMCKIIADKADEAEQECLNILKKHPDNVQALTTLAAVKTEAGKAEEALQLAEKLISLDIRDPDEIYKIATVCCENKLHADAYKMFCKLPADFAYDLTVMYFKAVAAFNCGKYKESFDTFDKIVTVYPNAVTARYYYNSAREMHACGKVSELSYYYRLPQELRESSLKMLAAYMRLPKSAAKKLTGELDLSDCILWCFDEGEDRGGSELQSLAAQVAVKARYDRIVREILLDAFIADKLKFDILISLGERNAFNCFGIVICNVYKRVTTQPLDIGKIKRRNFVRAYARLVAHFSILDDRHGAKFAEAAEKIYSALEADDRLSASNDIDALCAAIYIKSGVREEVISGEKVYSFFDVSEKRVKKITGEL